MRREFGSDPEPDESEAAGGLANIGRRYGRREPQGDQGANLGVVIDTAVLPELEPEGASSQFGVTDPEDNEAGLISTP